jgi:hypothetical protein
MQMKNKAEALGFVVAALIMFGIAYHIMKTVTTCDGTIVRGLFGLECIAK